jgi:hypothetical protein
MGALAWGTVAGIGRGTAGAGWGAGGCGAAGATVWGSGAAWAAGGVGAACGTAGWGAGVAWGNRPGGGGLGGRGRFGRLRAGGHAAAERQAQVAQFRQHAALGGQHFFLDSQNLLQKGLFHVRVPTMPSLGR